MKIVKIRQAFLLTLTLFTALQAATTFGMENGNEKIEKSENNFKYTASMAHLMTILPGNLPRLGGLPRKITLVPQPNEIEDRSSTLITYHWKEIWLWNDGVLSENGNTYSVTYKNKTYVSSKNANAWKATEENQMDYFTYYNYLEENKKLIDNEVKENFIDYLISFAMCRGKNDGKFSEEHNLNNVSIALKQALAKEKESTKKICFYSAYSAALETLYKFVTYLHTYLDITNEHRERSRFEKLSLYESVDDFINKKLENDVKQSIFLMSTNIALFGGLHHEGECTLAYFCNNMTYVGKDKILTYIEELCNTVGLKFTATDRKKLATLAEKYAEVGGKLKQILIDPAYADKISYISAAYGYAFKKEDSLKNAGDNYSTFAKKLIKTIAKTEKTEKTRELLNTSKVLELLCIDPQNESLIKSCKNKIEGYDHGEFIDKIQARLLHFSEPFFDPEKAKEYGLEIFYYFAKKGAREKQKELDKQMDAHMKDMLWEALEKKTLTGGAENSKLVGLYNAGKIKGINDLQIDNLKKLAQ